MSGYESRWKGSPLLLITQWVDVVMYSNCNQAKGGLFSCTTGPVFDPLLVINFDRLDGLVATVAGPSAGFHVPLAYETFFVA